MFCNLNAGVIHLYLLNNRIKYLVNRLRGRLGDRVDTLLIEKNAQRATLDIDFQVFVSTFI